MTLNSLDSLKECIRNGTYSTNLSEPNRKWKTHHEGTFADFLSMKSGDNIYFFIKRKIYGIGTIKNIKTDCKFLNYIGADEPAAYTDKDYIEGNPMLENATAKNSCFCTFELTPYFFRNEVDRDDALNSNPSAFKILRAMWKVSFIKIDNIENQAFVDIILKRNEEKIASGEDTFVVDKDVQIRLEKRLTNMHRLTAYKILESCA